MVQNANTNAQPNDQKNRAGKKKVRKNWVGKKIEGKNVIAHLSKYPEKERKTRGEKKLWRPKP